MALTEKQKEKRKALREKRRADKAIGKLKKIVMYIDVGDLTYREWVVYRREYLGGSDAATYLKMPEGGNLNPYQSRLELFHEKVGVITKTGEETEATYSGHVLEPHIIENYWRWHNMENPTHEERMRLVYDVGKPLRYCRKVKDQILYDPRFPYIKINIDGFIQNTRFEKSPRGILEVKSGLSYVWNEYKSGIPEFYIIQAQTYMLVTGIKYCEIAVLLDGRYFKCYPVWADKDLQDKIRQDAEEFWTLVQEGREIWNDPDLTQEEKTQYLGEIEPEIDGSPALDKYLKDRFKSDYKAGKMMITPEITDYAMSYLEMHKEEKKWKEQKDSYGQMLRKIFLDNKVDEIIADDGKTVLISHRKPSENRNPVLRLRKDIEQFF